MFNVVGFKSQYIMAPFPDKMFIVHILTIYDNVIHLCALLELIYKGRKN